MSIQVTKRPFSQCFSGNPVHYQLYSSAAVADSSIIFEMKVMFRKPGESVFNALNEPLEFHPVNGYADIDIKDILHSALEYGLIPFYDDETTIYKAPLQTGHFYLQFREITTVNPDPGWDTSEADALCFVVKGGLNYFHYRGNNYWLNYFPVQKPFLTWQLSGRLAAVAERMYLAWLSVDDVTDLKLRTIVYYTDGTASAPQEIAFPSSEKETVYYLPAGCSQLDLPSIDTTKTIWYWTHQVIDDATPVSEVFKFELDNRNSYNDATLHYRNSLGGLDSVRVRGVIEQALNYSFTEIGKTTTPDYFDGAAIQAQRSIVDNLEQNPMKGDIGHLKKEEQDRLRDAFIQREVYQEFSKKWWPVIISTKNNKFRTSQDQRFTMPIEWELAYDGGEYYTPRSVDLGDGVFTDNVCLAFLSPFTAERDDAGSAGDWLITAGENDPQMASENMRYRIVRDSDSTVLVDWTEVPYGSPIPFSVPDDSGTYTIYGRSVCTNNILGKVTALQIDTDTSGGGSGGSGGSGGGAANATVNNDSVFSGMWNMDVDSGAETHSRFIGAFNSFNFDLAAVPGPHHIVITLDFYPSNVTIVTAAATWTPASVVGNVWDFGMVYIGPDGFTINIS